MNNEKNEENKKEGHTRLPNGFTWECLREISGNALKVLVILKSYNPSFPSYSKIEEHSGLGRKCISRVLKELVEIGLISYERGNSLKASNHYQIEDLTSFQKKLVSKRNQFPLETSTSFQKKLELVSKGNSNKTNKIKLNNKTKGESGMALKILKAIEPIDEFKNIENALTQEILGEVSHRVQRNWIDLYRDKGIDWLKEEIVDAVAYYVAKDAKNFGASITNWLKKARTPPPWAKEDRKEKEERVARELREYFNGSGE